MGVDKFMEEAKELRDMQRCPTCGNNIKRGEFKDELSIKEFQISGMCQRCQDSVFGAEEDYQP